MAAILKFEINKPETISWMKHGSRNKSARRLRESRRKNRGCKPVMNFWTDEPEQATEEDPDISEMLMCLALAGLSLEEVRAWQRQRERSQGVN